MRANHATDAAPPAAPSLALMDREPSTVMTAPPAAVAVPVAGPMASAMQALQAGVPLEQLHGLLDLQKDWEANEARKAFMQAKAAFKTEAIVITKDKTNDQYGSGYTSIGNLVNTVTPILSRHGLTADWDVDQKEGIFVTCILSHAMGHSERTSIKVPADNSGAKNPIQQIKSSITYAKVITLENACGLASSDANLDDDGNGAGNGSGYNAAENLEHWLKLARAAKTEEEVADVRVAACNDFETARDLEGWAVVREEIRNIRLAMRAKAGQQ